MLPPAPKSTLFPYTTLFRSEDSGSTLEQAIEAMSRYGICKEKYWPFDPDRLARKPSSKAFGDAEKQDRKSTRLNSSHRCISYAVFCLKKKKKENIITIN